VFHKDSMKIARDFITGEMSVNKNEYGRVASSRGSMRRRGLVGWCGGRAAAGGGGGGAKCAIFRTKCSKLCSTFRFTFSSVFLLSPPFRPLPTLFPFPLADPTTKSILWIISME
jgi:hypothetical protein